MEEIMGVERKVQTMDVGGRLRELRQERDLSMRSLARLSGLSTNALSMIERGRTSPSVSTLYKLSEALEQAKEKLLNKETAKYCRQRYLDNFSLEQFEYNLVKTLNSK